MTASELVSFLQKHKSDDAKYWAEYKETYEWVGDYLSSKSIFQLYKDKDPIALLVVNQNSSLTRIHLYGACIWQDVILLLNIVDGNLDKDTGVITFT